MRRVLILVATLVAMPGCSSFKSYQGIHTKPAVPILKPVTLAPASPPSRANPPLVLIPAEGFQALNGTLA
jgi:hypothetical protein